MRVDTDMIKTAKRVNLPAFLADRYPDEIKRDSACGAYRNTTHDSIVINKHAWYRFSTGEGGDTIEYLVKLHHMTFQEAVKNLSDYGANENELICINSKRRYRAPAKHAGEPQRVIDYLIGRGISAQTIDELFSKGLLYEDYKGNAVFCRCDRGMEMCVIKGTLTGTRFNKIITRISDNYWLFTVGINPDTIYICESPIDAISLYECNARRPGYYVSMNGLKPRTVERIIKELGCNGKKMIKFAVDWDSAGIDFYVSNGYQEKYSFVGAGKYSSFTKDWNDVLIALNR